MLKYGILLPRKKIVLKKNNRERRLFPNPEIYDTNIDLPVDVQRAIDSLPYEEISQSQINPELIKQLIHNWVATIWQTTHYLIQIQSFSEEKMKEEVEHFIKNFQTQLIAFITHPDHGIIHAFYVYRGMHTLIDQENASITQEQDKQLQLLALLHDAMQTLPFSYPPKKSGILSQENQKNEHARIIAVLTRQFGAQLGLDPHTVRALAFGLKEHDSSYNSVYYPNGSFSYLSKLLHDADKLYGASVRTEIQELIAGGLRRNFQANEGIKGSFLLRADLTPKYRAKLTYGDRCYSDSLAVALKEFNLQMYTQAGTEVASQKLAVALEQMQTVYGELYDQTRSLIETQIIPKIDSQQLQFYSQAMEHEPQTEYINSTDLLKKTILNLYEKVLILPEKYQRPNYKNTDARGWKLFVAIQDKLHSIDPSIARFCFSENGKQEFLDAIQVAFENQFPQTHVSK